MAGKTHIANLALGHFGQSRIDDLDQDSPSALALRDVWDIARDAVLRAHNWNFATTDATLTQLAAVPLAGGWAHQYQLPADYRRLISCNGILAGTRDCPFAVWARNVLVSNEDPVVIEYVQNVPETALWDPTFVEAFSFKLAELASPRLTLSPEMAKSFAARKDEYARLAMHSGAVESQPLVRKAQEGSAYLAARRGDNSVYDTFN